MLCTGINDVVSALPPGIQYSLYVGDFAIYVSGLYFSSLECRLQLAINVVVEWADLHGFHFSETKSEALLFHKWRPAIFFYGLPGSALWRRPISWVCFLISGLPGPPTFVSCSTRAISLSIFYAIFRTSLGVPIARPSSASTNLLFPPNLIMGIVSTPRQPPATSDLSTQYKAKNSAW